ncbi:MAG: helix-turn-helix transcriptional regulator [Acetivibrio sp.]
MSQFSEKLKILIDSSGMTIYHLAKDSQLDRTTIQRSISGERLPGLPFVEKLCDYLRISPIERKGLLETYFICKIGPKIYADRKYIEDIIQQIAELHIRQNCTSDVKKELIPGNDIEENIKVFSGQYNVKQLIQDVLEDEVYNTPSPSISLTIPFSPCYFFDLLKQLYWESNGKFQIKHIIAFSKNPHMEKNPSTNLEVLSNVLPFAFCMGNGYQPHYYYSASYDASRFIHPMPFYFFTGKKLVTVSDDFKMAILYNNADVLHVYKEHFETCFSHSFQLVELLTEPWEMIQISSIENMNFYSATHVIESQPCFAGYYTHAMIDKHLRLGIPEREHFREQLFVFWDHFKTLRIQSFFTIQGIQTLVDHGRVNNLPAIFATPFSIKERIYLLTSLCREIQEDLYFARILDTRTLSISQITTIQICSNQSILFMATTQQGIVNCSITESSICNAFYDFFENLSESKLLYSKEDTLQILKDFIEKLDSMEE